MDSNVLSEEEIFKKYQKLKSDLLAVFSTMENIKDQIQELFVDVDNRMTFFEERERRHQLYLTTHKVDEEIFVREESKNIDFALVEKSEIPHGGVEEREIPTENIVEIPTGNIVKIPTEQILVDVTETEMVVSDDVDMGDVERFDRDSKPDNMVLSNDDMTVENLKNGLSSIVGKKLVQSGEYEWYFRIDKIKMSRWIALGVVDHEKKENGLTDFYGISSSNQVYPKNESDNVSGDWKVGDIIKLYLSLYDNDSLLTITNQSTGKGHTMQIPSDRKYLFHLHIHTAGNKVTLSDSTSL